MFQESIAAELLQKLVNWCKNIKISDPLEEGCRLGPVVSKGQVERLMIELASFCYCFCFLGVEWEGETVLGLK